MALTFSPLNDFDFLYTPYNESRLIDALHFSATKALRPDKYEGLAKVKQLEICSHCGCVFFWYGWNDGQELDECQSCRRMRFTIEEAIKCSNECNVPLFDGFDYPYCNNEDIDRINQYTQGSRWSFKPEPLRLFLVEFETSDAAANIAWVKAQDKISAIGKLENCLFYGGYNHIQEETSIRDIPEYPDPEFVGIEPNRK